MWELFLYFVISTIAGELLRPKPKFNTPNPSALGEFQMPTAEYGRAVPVVYGECHLKGPNVVWYGDLRSQAITEEVDTGWFSSETITKGYRYYMGAQLVFCKGFSAWELRNGSGLVELRFDDKRPTSVAAALPPRMPGGLLIPPNTQAFNSTYTHTNIYANDPDAMFTRVNIANENIFGGDEKEGGISGVIDFHYGQPGAVRNDYLQRVFNQADVPAYQGYAYAVMRQCYVGTTSYPKPISAVIRRYPWFWDTDRGWQVGLDANPIAIITDLMTNTEYGLGIPVSQIGPSFKTAAMACYNEGTGLSMVFDNQGTARDMVSEVLRHVDGVAYTDPATGLYEIALARDDYDTNTLLDLTPDNVVSLTMSRPSWAETKNVVRIKYTNADANYAQSVVEQHNLSNIQVRGGVKADETYTFLGISSTETANKVAARVLRTVSYPLARFNITATRVAFAMRPGSVFKLTWPDLGISGMVCRCTRISYGSLADPAITLEAVEDIFGTMDTDFVAPPASEWTNPVPTLTINAAEQLVEAPYHMLGAEARKVMTLAARSNYLAEGYTVLSDPAGVMVSTAKVQKFTPTGRLAAAVDAQATSITLDAVVDINELPAITLDQQRTGDYLLIVGDELMTFNALTLNLDNTYTAQGVERGVMDTLPAAHAASERAWLVSAGAGLVQSAGYPADKTVNAKLLPYDTTRQVEATDAALLTITTHSRAYKPYPPARVRINGAQAPSQVVGDAVVSWAHRPKAYLLANDVVVGHEVATAYAADAGTSYTVEVQVDGATVLTQTGLTGTSYTYPKATHTAGNYPANAQVVVKLYAVSGGYMSAAYTSQPFTVA